MGTTTVSKAPAPQTAPAPSPQTAVSPGSAPQCVPRNNVGNFDLSSVFHVQQDYLFDTAIHNANANSAPQIVGYVNDVQNKLKSLSGQFQDANTSSQAVLAHQQQMLDIVNAERERLEEKKQLVDSADMQQQHVMVLNNTYRKKYTDYTKVVIVSVIGIGVFILLRMMGNFLQVPEWIVVLLHIANILICMIVITTIYATIQSRDRIDYDKLNLPPPNTGPASSASSTDISNASLFGQFCWGEQCCDSNNGVVWDERLGMCRSKTVPSPAPSPVPSPVPSPAVPSPAVPSPAPSTQTFSFAPAPGKSPAPPPVQKKASVLDPSQSGGGLDTAAQALNNVMATAGNLTNMFGKTETFATFTPSASLPPPSPPVVAALNRGLSHEPFETYGRI